MYEAVLSYNNKDQDNVNKEYLVFNAGVSACGCTAAALMRLSWQVSSVCSVRRRPFCSSVSAAGVNAVLILLICKKQNTALGALNVAAKSIQRTRLSTE